MGLFDDPWGFAIQAPTNVWDGVTSGDPNKMIGAWADPQGFFRGKNKGGGAGMAGYPQPPAPDYMKGYDAQRDAITGDVMAHYNQQGLDKFRGEATRTGPSSWSALAKRNVNLQENQARDRAASDNASSTATARSNLAMRGGLSGGASERIAQGGARNYMNLGQQIGSQAAMGRNQVDINDEQNRIQQLGMLPGMEAQRAGLYGQSRSFDVGQSAAEGERRNAFNSKRYADQMGAWGANQTANAQANSGKK